MCLQGILYQNTIVLHKYILYFLSVWLFVCVHVWVCALVYMVWVCISYTCVCENGCVWERVCVCVCFNSRLCILGYIHICKAASNIYNMYLHFLGCTSMVSKLPEQLSTAAHTWKSGILMALSTQDGKNQAVNDLHIPSFTISYYVYNYYDPKIRTLCMITFFSPHCPVR